MFRENPYNRHSRLHRLPLTHAFSEKYKVVGLNYINDYYDVNLKCARLAELGIFLPLSHE